MKRLFLLLFIAVPYWAWLGHRTGVPHLSPGSLAPLVYAILALIVFVALAFWLFQFDYDDCVEGVSRIGMGSVGGIALVYAIGAAASSPLLMAKILGGLKGLVFGTVGVGNSVKDIPSLPLWDSIVAYTLGVGLTEELAKAVSARSDVVDGIRTRAGYGFIAGIGFGVAEALIYSYRNYAGTADWTMYVVRFVSLAGFHGCEASIAVMCLPQDWWDRNKWLTTCVRLLPVALLHGAYDALVMRDHLVAGGIIATGTILLVPIVLWLKERFSGDN